MDRVPISPRARLTASWPWLLACLPALWLLALILRFRVPVPYTDSWAFVEQYLKWTRGHFGWRELFEKHGDHPSAVGKVIYFAVLHGLRGDVGVLPVLSWALSLVVAVCVALLARPLWKGDRVRGAILMTSVSLVIFSAAQAGVWLWDFTFQNYIPGACLALGLLVLSAREFRAWRIAVAALLGVVATFSFGAGFLVSVLLAPLVWRRLRGAGFARPTLALAGWLVFHGFMAAIALKGFGPAGFTEEGPRVSLMVIFDRPLLRFQFVLVLLGQMLGQGTALEPFTLAAIAGGLLLAVFAACLVAVFRRRTDGDLVDAALPWILLSLYGLGNAVLICIGRMGAGQDAFAAFNNIYALAERTMAERFITLTLYFSVGVIMLAGLLLRSGAPSRLGRLVPVGLAAFILLHLVNGAAGGNLMEIESRLMKQERAMLGFGSFLRLDGERLWNRQLKYHTYEFARGLAETGRLRDMSFVAGPGMEAFQRGGAAAARWAKFSRPELAANGRWELGGSCGMVNRDMDALPDLVVITVEGAGMAERVAAIAAPQLPENFLERQSQRRKYPEHYFGWSAELDAKALPKGRLTLRSYAYFSRGHGLRPLNGTHVVENPGD